MTEKKRTILIADDEEDIKIILKLYLESVGFLVLTAFDGLDALTKIKESQPDLVLMDIMMPVMNGIEVTKQLKAQDETKNIPIVMLSAAAQSEMVERSMRHGASGYIAKPFDPNRVKEIIDQTLSEQTDASEE